MAKCPGRLPAALLCLLICAVLVLGAAGKSTRGFFVAEAEAAWRIACTKAAEETEEAGACAGEEAGETDAGEDCP